MVTINLLSNSVMKKKRVKLGKGKKNKKTKDMSVFELIRSLSWDFSLDSQQHSRRIKKKRQSVKNRQNSLLRPPHQRHIQSRGKKRECNVEHYDPQGLNTSRSLGLICNRAD
uniref:Uncharacterized protein n=1 Tax=Cacopsylla melanoneura TaxID=428564 RepID=A0A8D8RQB3_9HEMI